MDIFPYDQPVLLDILMRFAVVVDLVSGICKMAKSDIFAGCCLPVQLSEIRDLAFLSEVLSRPLGNTVHDKFGQGRYTV